MNLLLSVEESTVCVRAEKTESARRMGITAKYIEFRSSLAQKCASRNGAEGAQFSLPKSARLVTVLVLGITTIHEEHDHLAAAKHRAAIVDPAFAGRGRVG